MTELQESIELAGRGREVWLKIKEKYNYTPEDCLIIFATQDRDLADLARKYLPEYMRKKYFSRGIAVLKRDDAYIPGAEINREAIHDPGAGINREAIRDPGAEISQGSGNIICEFLTSDCMEALLKYYRLCQFAENIVVVSLEEPYGNCHMLGHKGIGLEDYIKNAIFS